MIKSILQVEAKVQDWVSHWNLAPNTPLEAAEQMCLQFLQYLGKCKEMAAQQAKEAEEKEKVEDLKPPEVVD